MAIVRWAFNSPAVASTPQRWFPATDVVEAEDAFVLRVDLPGMKQEDVTLEIEDNVLTVSGERKHEADLSGSGYRRLERSFGRFSRAMTLPQGVEVDAVTARFTDGVLEIRVPKPASIMPRRIEITSGDEQREQQTIEA